MNITDALGTTVLAAAVAAAFTFCAGPARAEDRIGPVLEVFGCTVMTPDRLDCNREWYDMEGTMQDCELVALSLRTNPGIMKAVCHFEH